MGRGVVNEQRQVLAKFGLQIAYEAMTEKVLVHSIQCDFNNSNFYQSNILMASLFLILSSQNTIFFVVV